MSSSKATSSTQSTPIKPSRGVSFLDLPAELRNNIYEYAYNDISGVDRAVLIVGFYIEHDSTGFPFALTKVHREIRANVMNWFINPVLISLSVDDDRLAELSRKFIINLRDDTLMAIRRVDIDDGAVTHQELCPMHPSANVDRLKMDKMPGRPRTLAGLDGKTFDIEVEFKGKKVEIVSKAGACGCKAIARLGRRIRALKRAWDKDGGGAEMTRVWLLQALEAVSDPVK